MVRTKDVSRKNTGPRGSTPIIGASKIHGSTIMIGPRGGYWYLRNNKVYYINKNNRVDMARVRPPLTNKSVSLKGKPRPTTHNTVQFNHVRQSVSVKGKQRPNSNIQKQIVVQNVSEDDIEEEEEEISIARKKKKNTHSLANFWAQEARKIEQQERTEREQTWRPANGDDMADMLWVTGALPDYIINNKEAMRRLAYLYNRNRDRTIKVTTAGDVRKILLEKGGAKKWNEKYSPW